MSVDNLRLLLGVSGGIAAYKIPLLIRLLKKNGVEVKVVLTEAAKTLVGEDALKTVSNNPVFSDKTSTVYDMDHIGLAQWADVFLISPCTANMFAKIAHGIGDNLLSTLVLSFEGSLILAPAMNTAMWNNIAVESNIALIKKRGIRVLPVGYGSLACGDEGAGRMLSIDSLAEYVYGALLPQCLKGKNVLIASGPTREAIDPVRVLTNCSTGRMGAALAYTALAMGASVTVVAGQSEIPLPEEITRIDVVSSRQMSDALHDNFTESDFCIMAAAISDFCPKDYSKEKIKRSDNKTMMLELIPNKDIASSLGQKKKNQFLVCFSLETDGGEERAIEKMQKKACDMMVYNNVKTSLGINTSKITLLFQDASPQRLSAMSKRKCAQQILLEMAKKAGLYHA